MNEGQIQPQCVSTGLSGGAKGNGDGLMGIAAKESYYIPHQGHNSEPVYD